MMIRPQSISNAISTFEIGYRPSEMTAVVLLHNGQVEEELVFDESARIFLDDPQAGTKLQDSSRGARDFMRDTFGGEHSIGIQLSRMGWILAAELDDYTLVAVAPPGPFPQMVEKWLKRLAGLLTSKYSN